MEFQNPTSSSSFWFVFLHAILLCSMSFSLFTNSTTVNALGNETDRFSLLKFKESISYDPHEILSSWNDSRPFCSWHGVTCSSRHQRLMALNLRGHNLRGILSPHIGNLTFLRFLSLESNRFYGEIPQQVGRLLRLRHLNLSHNTFEGKIPLNLSYCSELRVLDLKTNRLTGMIPLELGSLVKIVELDLGLNNLTGGIPASLGNMSSVALFSVGDNHLDGTLPNELGRLKRSIFFLVGPNDMFGVIPLSLYNMSSMRAFSIPGNHFSGTLPPNIGLTLPNLQQFAIGGNAFTGTIPESLSNASQIQKLDFAGNNFIGQVPTSFGNLPYLWWLGLSSNNLGSHSAKSLDFITSLTNCSIMKALDLSGNRFGGVLPNSVANLSTHLTILYLGGNQIVGNVPSTLNNLVNLISLGLEYNLLTGVIPDSLGKLHNLQILALESNLLVGKIPLSIGNLSKIFKLDLSGNKLEGSIPPNFADLQMVQYLDISNNRLNGVFPKEIFGFLSSIIVMNLSRNSLSGSLPVQVGKLKKIHSLDLSENNLTSDIPKAIGDCESLEFLYLQGNFFRGTLPLTLASLRGLRFLDLSGNNLVGEIPNDLQNIPFLLYLNLSFNDLEGVVPTKGVFQNTSTISVLGNDKLCGGVPELQLPRCPINDSKQGKKWDLKLTIITVSVGVVLFMFSGFIIFYSRLKSASNSSPARSTIGFLPKVSYKTLYQATSGFSPSMLIGTGSFSSVYKGILDQEQNLIAIKVLNLQKKGAAKSFIAECNALRHIRHRNLVKILTCCSGMDYKGNEFKALVFEYMSNGSLEKWLHSVTGGKNISTGLNLIQRLNISIHVACALQYLHDDCDPPIIHCDLKPGNVLLDNEMIAHISDFGLAKLTSDTTDFSKGQTSTIGIKGTVGYVAPEYSMGCEPSRQGDVYSYGILVLEMFTGRRPTDEIFKDDFNLHSFVKMALPERLVQIADSSLLPQENAIRREEGRNYNNNGGIETDVQDGNINFEIRAHLQKCLVSVLEIGVACSQESPNERMIMGEVIRELQHIRDAYLSVGSTDRPEESAFNNRGLELFIKENPSVGGEDFLLLCA